MSMLQIHLFKIIDNLSFDFCYSLIYNALFSHAFGHGFLFQWLRPALIFDLSV